MASKNPAPDDAPNRERDLVTMFRDEYAVALEAAEEAATMTATAGWRTLVADRRKADRKVRRTINEELTEIAAELVEVGVVPDKPDQPGTLKRLAAARKGLAENHRSLLAFEDRTLDPVREKVRKCQEIAERFRKNAQQEEERHPLHQAGLLELMRAAIADVDVPTWNEDDAVIEFERRG